MQTYTLPPPPLATVPVPLELLLAVLTILEVLGLFLCTLPLRTLTPLGRISVADMPVSKVSSMRSISTNVFIGGVISSANI